MAVWPAWVLLKSRDEDDRRQRTGGEIWLTRAAGVGAVVGGGYGLYAIVTGMPGSDFLTP
jgi:hypothetical protein